MKLPFEKVRQVIVRKEFETDPDCGCNPDKRKVEELINFGIVNIDKPKGPTSHQVSDYVQRILGIKKAGHSGTLDPGVTGVLPVALDRATRIVQALLPSGKEYVALMHLHSEVDRKDVEIIFKKFTGKIKQIPPIKSSVKRVEREREIYYLKILDMDEKDVLFLVGCQAGTYIRKLTHDMGEELGTGAHMAELRRTRAGPFDESTLVTLQDLADAYWYWKNEKIEKHIRNCIKPIEFAVRHLPRVWITDNTVDTLCHGASLNNPGIAKLNSGIEEKDTVAVMTLKDELVALGIAKTNSKGMLKKKGLAVKTEKVFMLPGTYPSVKE